MNINSINSTPAFKGNEVVLKEGPYVVIENSQPDSFSQTTNTEEVVRNGINAAMVAVPATAIAKKIGKNAATSANNNVREILSDFATNSTAAVSETTKQSGKVAAKLKGSFKKLGGKLFTQLEDGTKELSKNAKGAIKWGVTGVAAAALIYLGVKDSDNDGKSDILEGIKKFIKPSSIE